MPGNGTITQLQNYTFVDPAPNVGTNYYRLRQVDFDGHFEFSPVTMVKNTPDNFSIVSVYPNPLMTSESVSLELITKFEGKVPLILYSLAGQELRRFELDVQEGTNKFRFDVSGLPAGTYLATMILGDETFQEKLMVK